MNAYTVSRLALDAGVSVHIVRDYLLRGFPRLSISIQKGSPISPRAITVREANNKEKISEIEEIDETIWLEGRLTNNQKLWEQSYKQEGDYRITALYVEESESMDEDEIYAEEQSRWDVKFR